MPRRLLRGLVVLPLCVGLISLEEARTQVLRRLRLARDPQPSRLRCHRDESTDADDLAADRAAARRLVAYCGAIAVAIATAFILLPI